MPAPSPSSLSNEEDLHLHHTLTLFLNFPDSLLSKVIKIYSPLKKVYVCVSVKGEGTEGGQIMFKGASTKNFRHA